MKIGILTQRIRGNYGGVLQNYALQAILKERGHNPVTIDEPTLVYKKDITFVLRIMKRAISKLLGDKNVLYVNPQKQINVYSNQDSHKEFVDKYLNRIIRNYPLSASITEQEGFDGYIVGSDQVWRPTYQTDLGNCFLDFTAGQNVKRGAYAASFGVDHWEMTVEQTEYIKRFCDDFDMVTVREDSAVELCKNNLQLDAQHVVDPTMLLTAEHYKRLISPVLLDRKEKIVVAYFLDKTPAKIETVNKLCQQHGATPLYIGDLIDEKYQSIEHWLNGFNQAKYVVTDSFHGTVFSILFQKQFIVFGNKQRGQSRFTSLLKMFGIEDRLVGSDCKPEQLKPIDYSAVNEILSQKREYALNIVDSFLKNQRIQNI